MTVVVTNPKDVTPAEATVTYGTDVKRLTVAPGTSAKATFPRRAATEATVAIDGLPTIIAPVGTPACEPGKPGDEGGNDGTGGGDSTGGGEGGLPVTGPMAGAIAGGALVLLVAGGVLYVLARRRRITFTP